MRANNLVKQMLTSIQLPQWYKRGSYLGKGRPQQHVPVWRLLCNQLRVLLHCPRGSTPQSNFSALNPAPRLPCHHLEGPISGRLPFINTSHQGFTFIWGLFYISIWPKRDGSHEGDGESDVPEERHTCNVGRLEQAALRRLPVHNKAPQLSWEYSLS